MALVAIYHRCKHQRDIYPATCDWDMRTVALKQLPRPHGNVYELACWAAALSAQVGPAAFRERTARAGNQCRSRQAPRRGGDGGARPPTGEQEAMTAK